MSEVQPNGFLGGLFLELQGALGVKCELDVEPEGVDEGDGDSQRCAEDRILWRPDAPDYGPIAYQPADGTACAESLLDFEVLVCAADIDRYWDLADGLVGKLDLILGPRRGSAEKFGYDVKRGKRPKKTEMGLVFGTFIVTLKRPAYTTLRRPRTATASLTIGALNPDGSGAPAEEAVLG